MEKPLAITGHTRLAAVLASPISHSLSPLIHNTAFKLLDIDAVYLAFDVTPDKLEEAFTAVKLFNLLGCNLSMPNKLKGFELVDEHSIEAKLIGSINTVVQKNGYLTGYNTDGIGFINNLKAEGVEVASKKLIVFGAGGAGLAIIVQAALEGAKELVVVTRDSDKTQSLVSKLQEIQDITNCHLKRLSLEDSTGLFTAISDSDILINTTSVGMEGNSVQELLPSYDALHKHTIVVDIIYQPLETPLLLAAKNKGCQTINGIGMLVYQAAAAFNLWTEKEMPINQVKEALECQGKC